MKIKVRVLVLPVEEELQTGVEFRLQGKSAPEDLIKELALAYPLFRQMITDTFYSNTSTRRFSLARQ